MYDKNPGFVTFIQGIPRGSGEIRRFEIFKIYYSVS